MKEERKEEAGLQHEHGRQAAFVLLLRQGALLAVYSLALLPYGLLCMPFVLTTRFIANKKAREAKNASQVLERGEDR
jgi:hypothetical protein